MAKHELFDSPKLRLLVRRLQLPRPYVIGHLELLWQAAHSKGDPMIGDAEMVEAAAEWEGMPGQFVAALEAGPHQWIDEVEPGLFEIHDYFEHCPSHVIDRVAKRLQRSGLIEKLTREAVTQAWADDRIGSREALRNVATCRDMSRHGGARRTLADSGGPQPQPQPQPVEKEMSDDISSSAAAGGGADPQEVVDFLAGYQQLALKVGLPVPERLTAQRKRSLVARIRENPGSGPKVLAEIRALEFLQGIGGKDSWRGATIDWLLKPTNWTKVLERTYRSRASPQARVGEHVPRQVDKELEELVKHIVRYANAVRKLALPEPAAPIALEHSGHCLDLTDERLPAGVLEERFFAEYDRFHLQLWRLSSNGTKPPDKAVIAQQNIERYGVPHWGDFVPE